VRRRALRRESASAAGSPTAGDWKQWEFLLVLIVGLVFCAGVLAEWDLLNEAWARTGWFWAWRRLDVGRTALLMLPPFILIAWVVRRVDRDFHPAQVRLWLPLLVLSNYLLQILAMLVHPEGFEWLRAIVFSPMATSYFGDARAIRQPLGWLAHFHQIGLGVHSSTHPPGPILSYYAFIKLFGASRGALLGGCAVGLLGSLGILVIYIFSRLWTADQRSRIVCCSFYALIPALVVFFPEFDQFYPVLSMLLIYFGVTALRAGSLRYAVWAGAALFVALFFAYNLLASGIFLLYFGFYYLWSRNWPLPDWLVALRTSAVILATYFALAAALWLSTGYNPIAAFRTALRKQGLLAAYVHRSYRAFVLMDPYDFLLGAGIIALPILCLYLRRAWKCRSERREELALTLIGFATILTVDLSGLLRAESARVWLFLQPLLAVPIGLELAGVGWRRTRWILAVQWLILVCLEARMSFVAP
jgi:hypothetical protein